VGSATTAPVYIASTGRATAITSVDIAHGGTGATTAAAARTSLGITPANIGASGLQTQTKIINATAGWYRIAKTYAGINNVMGTFEIKAADSNRHSLTTLIAGSSYGVSPSI
jgi:hypothetical protein